MKILQRTLKTINKVNFKHLIVALVMSTSLCLTPLYTNTSRAAFDLAKAIACGAGLIMTATGVFACLEVATQAATAAVVAKKVVKKVVCNSNWGLSWMACPLQENLINIARAGYNLIEGFMVFRPSIIEANPQNAVYQYWVIFRNIANLVFLIGLAAVIFSQATSIGLSAYGVKKLLPRLLALAIIINLSFFLCQALVDLSNITGSGMVSLSNSISGLAGFKHDEAWKGVEEMITKGGGDTTAAVGTVAAVGGTAMAINSPMIAAIAVIIMVIAVLAIILAVVILIARQIIIVSMIVLAPLAIVAAALPGTKKFYEFWKNTFASMLFMYPIISLMFAGSQLLASLLADMEPPFFLPGLFSGGEAVKYMETLVIIIILVVPFFAIPFVVKTSGGMLGKLTGAIDKFSGAKLARDKAMDYGKERYGEFRKDRQNQYVANLGDKRRFNPRAALARRTIARKESYRSNDEAAKLAAANIAAQQVLSNKKSTPEQIARAQAVQRDLKKKQAEMQFEARIKFIVDRPALKKELDQAVKSGDVELQKLIVSKMVADGDKAGVHDYFSRTDLGKDEGETNRARQAVASHVLSQNSSDMAKDLEQKEAIKNVASNDASASTATYKSSLDDGTFLRDALKSASVTDVAGQKSSVLQVQLRGDPTTGAAPKLSDVEIGRIVSEIHGSESASSKLSAESRPLVEYLARHAPTGAGPLPPPPPAGP